MHQEATPSLALSLILPVIDSEDTPGDLSGYKPGLLSLPFPTSSRYYIHAPTVPPSVGTLTPHVCDLELLLSSWKPRVFHLQGKAVGTHTNISGAS